MFELEAVDAWSARLLSVSSLKGRYGNYSLTVQAVDLGTPQKSAIANLDICITDFNDNAPVFVSPPHNTTIRVPEVRHPFFTLIYLSLECLESFLK